MAFVGFFVTLGIGPRLFHSDPFTTMRAAMAVGGFFAVLGLALLATTGRRYARRAILPVLARALRPLHPAPEEIDDAREALKARGGKLGKVLKTGPIMDALPFALE